MVNRGNKDRMSGEVTNGGDRKRGTVSNANVSDVRWRATTSEEASGVMWSDAPEFRSQRGQEIPESETDGSLWTELA